MRSSSARRIWNESADPGDERTTGTARSFMAAALAFALLSLAAVRCLGDERAEPYALDSEKDGRTVSVHQNLKVSEFGYLEAHDISRANTLGEILYTGDLSVPLGGQTFFASVEGFRRYSNEHNDSEGTVLFRELYFEYTTGLSKDLPFWDEAILRIGKQVFSWGSGVLFNPTDNLSPWYAVDPLEPRRRGIPAAKLSLGSGVQTLELIYIPAFEATQLPEPGQRFFIYSPATAPNPNYPLAGPPEIRLHYTDVDDSLEPSSGRSGGQYATRYNVSLNGFDVAFSYFNGYENTPVFEAATGQVNPATGEADVTVRYIFPKEQVLGLDVSRRFGALGAHFEGAYFDMEKTGHDVGIGDKDYISMIGGADYTFYRFVGSQDLSFSLEHAREIRNEDDNRIRINRIYTDSVLLRISHVVSYRWSGELRYVYDFDSKGYWGRLSYSYQYSDHTRVTAGMDILGGPQDTFFGAYDPNDRIFAALNLEY